MNARITFDDVRNAVGEQNLYSTNAGKIRAELGRGSASTVQKHLDTLRAELQKQQEAPAQEALPLPPAPQDVLAGIWLSAFEAARGRVSQHIASLSDRVAVAAVTMSAQTQDKASLCGEIERLETELESAGEAAVKVAVAAALAATEAEAVSVRQHEKITSLEADCSQLKAEQQVARHDAEIQLTTLQQVVDRASERTAELRSELEHERRRNEELVGKLEALAKRPG